MFDKLKLGYFWDSDTAILSFDLQDDEIARVMAAAEGSYTPLWEMNDTGHGTDWLGGEIKIEGITYRVYTEFPGDPYNEHQNRRWTFQVPYESVGDERLNHTRYIDYKNPPDVSHMWVAFVPLMRFMHPLMSTVTVDPIDPMIEAIPVSQDEIRAVFQERETQYGKGEICINDGPPMWGVICRNAVNAAITDAKARAARALHIFTNCTLETA